MIIGIFLFVAFGYVVNAITGGSRRSYRGRSYRGRYVRRAAARRMTRRF